MTGVTQWVRTVGLKPSATATKPSTQRVPGGLMQATQVAFVPVACPFMGQAAPDCVTPVNASMRSGASWLSYASATSLLIGQQRANEQYFYQLVHRYGCACEW